MLTLSLFRALSSAAAMIPWMLNLATRMLARSLNMPEPMLRDTGVFVFAQVQAVENSVGKSLCPVRLLRRLQAWLRQSEGIL
jgi:hypothetical protein